MLTNPQNLGANEVSQQATYSQFAQPVYSIRMSSTTDLTMKESQKNKTVKEDGLDKWVALEQRLIACEGSSLHDHIKASEMCLVPNVVIPKKFRVLEFVKYTRTQCLVTHLKTYRNKIAKVVHDEKLLIHFFQDSLSDVALTWYIQLDNTKVKKWEDLVDVFIRQYKFNMDVGPDRLSLQAMEKDNKESITRSP